MPKKVLRKKKGSGGISGKKKAKGKGKGRKRAGWSSEEEGGSPEPKRKGRKKKAEQAVEPAPEPIAPVKPAPAEPGFDALLEAFGVKQSDDEKEEEGEEEAEEEDAAAPEEDAAAPEEDAASPVEADEVEEEEEEEEEDEEQQEQERKVEQLEADWPDYYPNFWAESPVSLAASGGVDACPPNFSLPGLPRCEVRERDVGVLLEQLRSLPKAGSAWRRCRLFPGLGQLFSQVLETKGLRLGPEEDALFLFLHAYLDVSFPLQTQLNSSSTRAMYMLHVVDHLQKASQEVAEHNKRIRRAGAAAADCIAGDQGFARTRVLVLCPFKSVCCELVQLLLALCPKKRIDNRQRFEEEFMDDNTPSTRSDWRIVFEGNHDDYFRMGVTLRRKSLRFFTPFEKSDLLFCSPLGLRQITGVEGERKRDFDFLSSIELCIVDRADVLRMQNWEHVQQAFEVVNHRPKRLGGTDISRLRPAFAEGRARAFRQTAVLSSGQSLDADALFRGAAQDPSQHLQKPKVARRWGVLEAEDEDIEAGVSMAAQRQAEAVTTGPDRNCRGWVRLAQPPEGWPLQRTLSMGVHRQFFMHVGCSTLTARQEALLQAFEARYWRPVGFNLERLMIVAADYLSFLRLRKFLRSEEASVSIASEYTRPSDALHQRLIFSKGVRRVLLITERLLWYRRFRLKGADYVLFYGPPETPEIYEDVFNGVRAPSTCNAMCLFTRQDGYALERIVGAERACRMLTSERGKVFSFGA